MKNIHHSESTYKSKDASEPIRVGTYPNNAKNQKHDSQQYRIYNIQGKSVTLCGNGGGMGAKTGLYSIPVNTTNDGKSQTLSTGSMVTSSCAVNRFENIIGYASACEFDEDSRPTKAISGADGKVYTVYEIKDGKITIKDKQYDIKLADGFYIIRKLTVRECMRLQTVPEWYVFPVSDSQAYKQLGNGWTCDVITHLVFACFMEGLYI